MNFSLLKDGCSCGLGRMGQVGSRLIHGRWFMVLASQLIMAMSGANHLFSLYSNDIKSSMGYDQTTLNLISFFKDLGNNLGIHSGLINEVAPPWVALVISATVNFFGYFMIWLAVTGHLNGVRVWQMCFFICIGANSQTFSNTGTLFTCVKNFPLSRGVVLGLLSGFLGLSGAILTEIYHALYGEDSKSLILLIAWLPAIVFIVFVCTIRVMKLTRLENESKIFYNLLYISLSLAGFLMAMIILQNRLGFTRAKYSASALGVTFFLLLPLVVAIKEECNGAISSSENSPNEDVEEENEGSLGVVNDNDIVANQPQVDEALDDHPKDQPSYMPNIFNPPKRGENYTILQALFSIDMLLLFVSTICGLGGTLTAIDNIGQIGSSLGYPTRSTTTFVSLISIWNYLGRVLSGLASEIVLAKYKFPRPMMMSILLIFSCIGHLLVAFAPPNCLYIASIIVGFGFGAQCPLVLAIISEIFGLKYYSTLQNFGTLAVPIGTYIFNVTLTGKLYDRVALKQLMSKGWTRKTGEALICVGVECYKLAFVIIAGITLFGSLVSFVLGLRTRQFYKGDIYKKFRESP